MASKEVLASAILCFRENFTMNKVNKLATLCVALTILIDAAIRLLAALAKVVHEISMVIGQV